MSGSYIGSSTFEIATIVSQPSSLSDPLKHESDDVIPLQWFLDAPQSPQCKSPCIKWLMSVNTVSPIYLCDLITYCCFPLFLWTQPHWLLCFYLNMPDKLPHLSLCNGCSLCLVCFPADIQVSHFLSSFKSLFKCHLLSRPILTQNDHSFFQTWFLVLLSPLSTLFLFISLSPSKILNTFLIYFVHFLSLLEYKLQKSRIFV